MRTADLIDWLEWLNYDEDCKRKNKLPRWVKFSIQEKIKELKEERKPQKMGTKEKLKELDNKMYNLNANLSALVHIQKLKTLKEAEEFMQLINGEIAKWIKTIRGIHENMDKGGK